MRYIDVAAKVFNTVAKYHPKETDYQFSHSMIIKVRRSFCGYKAEAKKFEIEYLYPICPKPFKIFQITTFNNNWIFDYSASDEIIIEQDNVELQNAFTAL